MAKPIPKPADYDAILALPDHITGEIFDGELHTRPRPAPPHAVASSAIQGELHSAYGRRRSPTGPGGWWIIAEPELHCGGHVHVPDVAGWRRERLPAPDAQAVFSVVPDWVCEVVSPSSMRRDRVQKMHIYGAIGVGHLWLVDPLARVLEAYVLQDSRWVVVGTWGGDDMPHAPPFDEMALDLSEWWLPDAPTHPPA